ncbi:MAG: hypothetical protein ACLQUY_10050 [Ktedonobacterales bacterium]
MTSPMNEERSQQAEVRQTVVENIDQYLQDGMPVLDMNGDKVGNVKMYSTAAGYLMVASGAFDLKDLYIPFRLIRNIDPHSIFLSATKDTLTEEYSQPPQTHIIVETRLVPGPRGNMSPQRREVQVLQSGYDGTEATLNSVNLGDLASRLAVGMTVYDVDGARLGDITQCDTQRGLMVVEKGLFKPRILLIPFSDLASFAVDNLSVYLSLPKDAVVKSNAMLPTDA